MAFQKVDNLIVVSNREPYSHKKTDSGVVCQKNTGGLISSIDAIMRSGLWIAWGSGNADFITGRYIEVPSDHPRYTLKRVALTEHEINNYYFGFSNKTLWPLFHQLIEKSIFNKTYWSVYSDVNRKFAEAVTEEATEESFIWIHDYHLSLLPKFIRDEFKGAKIAMFWHIPWVHWDIFSIIPQYAEIIEGILGVDLLGFHTVSFKDRFMECAGKAGYSVNKTKNTVNIDDRSVKIMAFPIGIDYNAFSGESERIHPQRNEVKIIFGMDRLDYTKGILNRMLAFERFLEMNPKYKEKVTLIQVTSPSRKEIEDYATMKRSIEENVGRINGIYGTLHWTPIKYFYQKISQKTLLRYYKTADVLLITPFMDGMNLIVKEYIAAKDLGVVILSKFAGAAEDLAEAIIANPYDIDGIADAMKLALEMPETEKIKKFAALKERVRSKDVNWWLNEIFDEWREIYKAPLI